MKSRERDDRYWLGGASRSLETETNTFKTFLQTLKCFSTLKGCFHND
jgi:hypothetical protein